MPRVPDPLGLDPLTAIDIMFGQCSPDALIAFGSRRKKKDGESSPHWLFAVPVGEREQWFPAVLRHQVEQTQYVMQNPLGKRALVKGTVEAYTRAIDDGEPLYYAATNNNVTELAAMVVDLDVGRGPDDLTAWDALAVIGNRTDTGELPLPSLAALSGRGVYLWWLLTDDNKHPPAATSDNISQWKKVANELLKRCADLKADHNAKRLANWYKRPGTIDTNTGNEVKYLTFGVNHPGAVPRYELPDLMELLELHHAPMEVPRRTETARIKGSTGSKIGNPHATFAKRCDEIELLAQHRRDRGEGIAEGIREITLLHYRWNREKYLKVTFNEAGEPNAGGRAYAEARQDTRKFAEAYCWPLMTTAEVEQAFSGGFTANPRNTTVRDQLHVTDDEARVLELEVLVTDAVQAERDDARLVEKRRKTRIKITVDALLLTGLSPAEVARRTNTSRQRCWSRQKRLIEQGQIVPVTTSQELLEYEN